jgi:hypothetical protein
LKFEISPLTQTVSKRSSKEVAMARFRSPTERISLDISDIFSLYLQKHKAWRAINIHRALYALGIVKISK